MAIPLSPLPTVQQSAEAAETNRHRKRDERSENKTH